MLVGGKPAAGDHIGAQIGLAGGLDDLADVQLAARGNAQAGGGVGVRVKVNHQGGDAGGQCRRRQAERD